MSSPVPPAFPSPHTVNLLRFNGSQVDELGNTVPAWAEPVPVAVIGWQSASAESVEGHESQTVFDVKLFTNPSFLPSDRDRIVLGDQVFEVVGSDARVGFHGWFPGNVVLLRRVEG